MSLPCTLHHLLEKGISVQIFSNGSFHKVKAQVLLPSQTWLSGCGNYSKNTWRGLSSDMAIWFENYSKNTWRMLRLFSPSNLRDLPVRKWEESLL